MKLGPITKLDKKNKLMPKKFDDDVMSANCGVIVIFPIFGQFGAIRKLNSGPIVWNLTKSENRTKKSLTQFSRYCFE